MRRRRGRTQGMACGPRSFRSWSLRTAFLSMAPSVALSAKFFMDLGHILSQSINTPDSLMKLPGLTEVQEILLHVAATAMSPSVTWFHENLTSLAPRKAPLHVRSIHWRGIHLSHSADASATMAPELRRYVVSKAVGCALESARSKVADRPIGFLVTPLWAAARHSFT